MEYLITEEEYKGYKIQVYGEYKVGSYPKKNNSMMIYIESREKDKHFVGLYGVAFYEDKKNSFESVEVASAFKDDYIELNKKVRENVASVIKSLKEKIDNKIEEDRVNMNLIQHLESMATEQALSGQVESKLAKEPVVFKGNNLFFRS